MTSGNPKFKIYPDYCHDLSPTIGKWCPLRAADIHDLHGVGLFVDGKQLYHHGNHPIKWVRVTGAVVAVDEFPGKKVYTLDDSSGICIQCTCAAPIPPEGVNPLALPVDINPAAAVIAKPAVNMGNNGGGRGIGSGVNAAPTVETPNVPWDKVDVGVVVKVKGKVGSFWDERLVEVVKIEVLRSTDQEVRCWNEVLAFKVDVLRKPWVVGEDEEEKCRRRAIRERQWKSGRKKKDKKSGTGSEVEKRLQQKSDKESEAGDKKTKKAAERDIKIESLEHKSKRRKDEGKREMDWMQRIS